MKYFTLLISFLMGKYNSLVKPQSEILTTAIILKIRRMVMLLSLLTMASIGLALSLVKSLEIIGSRWTQNASFSMDGNLSASLLGVALFLGLFLYAVSKRTWTRSEVEKKQAPAQRASSPLEEAVSLLVMDFVKEREFKRSERQQAWSSRQPNYDSKVNYESASAINAFNPQPPAI